MDTINTLLFSKTRDTKSPCRAHPTDAGIDFFLPNEFTEEDIKKSNDTTGSSIEWSEGQSRKTILIPPHESFLISTGIKAIVPKGYAMIFFNKSGVAAKRHLVVGAQVVDSDYRGEIHINMINTSKANVAIEAGDKIAQAITLPIGLHVPCEVDDIMKYSEITARGEGGFGSSGVK